jgi:hypothetical protein
MDCVSENECAAGADGGLEELIFGGGFGEGLFFFDGNVAKLCRIKDFSAGLTFNKFGVFLAGDDFDDGMFALGCHLGRESRMLWILPVSGHVVNSDFGPFWRRKFVVKLW